MGTNFERISKIESIYCDQNDAEWFFNFSELREHFKQSNETTDNLKFTISSCVIYEIRVNDVFKLFAYESYASLPIEVSLKKKRKHAVKRKISQ